MPPWVARGPNKQIAPAQLEQTIGADELQTLSQQTGISREEILARLSKTLPDAVAPKIYPGRPHSERSELFLKASRPPPSRRPHARRPPIAGYATALLRMGICCSIAPGNPRVPLERPRPSPIQICSTMPRTIGDM